MEQSSPRQGTGLWRGRTVPPAPQKGTRAKRVLTFFCCFEWIDFSISAKSMPKRDEIHILHDLLVAVSQTPKPTRIFQKANLTWFSLRSRLDNLEERGFVRKETDGGGRTRYYLTNKGLEAIRDIEDLYSKLGYYQRLVELT